MKETLALIEPDEAVRDALTRLLSAEGWEVVAMSSAERLRTLFEKTPPVAVISEFSLPDLPATDVLALGREFGVPVILTGHDVPLQGAVDTVHLGALDFLEKPFSRSRLLDLLSGLSGSQTDSAATESRESADPGV